MNIETLIICVNTHGIVPTEVINEISEPIIQELKYPINIFKINAVTYGVPFISSLNNTHHICSQIKRNIDEINFDKVSPEELTRLLKEKCDLLNRENTKNIIRDMTETYQLNIYANYYEFMFNVVKTTLHDEYVEKLFIKFNDNELDEYFNSIKLLNLNNINLFDKLKELGFDINQISLSHLVEILYKMIKMKNLIILDFTCSMSEDDKRNDRRIRRELIKKGLY